jgi:hypothetical protein
MAALPQFATRSPAVYKFVSVPLYYIPLTFVHRTVDRKQLGNTVRRRKVIHNKERKKETFKWIHQPDAAISQVYCLSTKNKNYSV